ncbi:hypothetical protein KDH_61610 [Dictyobacter sp. S3.2.2.5]|uniref:Winged helix DNA-binding domain-containing protein n=1 Tax=Dictyobacter halimunensis TaxID=3026934 RepID=A0ABQ6G3W2_9CHLR|nr:hypothetical protein KDH_61610 [Dictyobacter sp. S3.2.2.5]
MELDIARLRLLSQRIMGEKFESPEGVVRWMGAMQAQDYLQALWAIGLRMQNATVATIEQAIVERKILRTWPMRGTLHFVPSEDAKWMVNLSAARMLASTAHRRRQLELDEATIERTGILFYDALKGGKCLSRPTLMQLLEDKGISTSGQRGYHLLFHQSLTGQLCLGPLEGKQQTFTLLDEWVPQPRELSRTEALAEMTRRYFTSHGPATLQDFTRWTGLTVADAKIGLETVRSELVAETIAGQQYWMAPDLATLQPQTEPGIYLLPGFDEYLLGYKDREAVLAAEHADKIVPGNNGIFLPTLVVAGTVVGTWRRKLGKRSVEVTLQHFTQHNASKEAVIEASRRYSNFVGLSLSSAIIKASTDEAL